MGTGAIPNLLQLSKQISEGPRGVDDCREFLKQFAPLVTHDRLNHCDVSVGRLLDWCAITGVKLPAWATVRSELQVFLATSPLPILAEILHGLFRYDRAAYDEWLNTNRARLAEVYVKETDSLAVWLREDTARVEYIVDPGSVAPHEQTMSRLHTLRGCYPGAKVYQAQGEWPLPETLAPPHDDTRKDMPAENLPAPSDIEKNKVFSDIVEHRYLPESFYDFQQIWAKLRQSALELGADLCKALRQRYERTKLKGPSPSFRGLETFNAAITALPKPPKQASDVVRDNFAKAGHWASSFRNFVHQIVQYSQKHEDRIGRFVLINLNQSLTELPEMHAAFRTLFECAPDYFSLTALEDDERQIYEELGLVAEGWISTPPNERQRDLRGYVRAQRQARWLHARDDLDAVLDAIEEAGVKCARLDERLTLQEPRDAIIAFEVADPAAYLEAELPLVVLQLMEAWSIADWFYLIPLTDGCRFNDRQGLRIASFKLRSLAEQDEIDPWAILPLELPNRVQNALEHLPFKPSPRSELAECIRAMLNILNVLPNLLRRMSAFNGDPPIHPDPQGTRRHNLMHTTEQQISSVVGVALQVIPRIEVSDLNRVPLKNLEQELLLWKHSGATELNQYADGYTGPLERLLTSFLYPP